MNSLTAATFVTLACGALVLLGLWIRLRSRTAQHRIRGHHVLELARVLPPGSQMQESFSDGTNVRIMLGANRGPARGL